MHAAIMILMLITPMKAEVMTAEFKSMAKCKTAKVAILESNDKIQDDVTIICVKK